jgi:hypothetical protein
LGLDHFLQQASSQKYVDFAGYILQNVTRKSPIDCQGLREGSCFNTVNGTAKRPTECVVCLVNGTATFPAMIHPS